MENEIPSAPIQKYKSQIFEHLMYLTQGQGVESSLRLENLTVLPPAKESNQEQKSSDGEIYVHVLRATTQVGSLNRKLIL